MKTRNKEFLAWELLQMLADKESEREVKGCTESTGVINQQAEMLE